jgi:hypothetical protein
MSDIGRWRRVYSNDWHDAAFQGLSDAERVVWFYLKTGPQSTSVGIFRVSAAVAVEDIGNLTATEFQHRLDVVVRAFGWRYDMATRVLWIPNWLAENPPQSPNVAKSYRKLLANLPDCDLKAEAALSIGRQLKDFPQAFLEAFGKDFAKAFPQPKSKTESLPEPQTESNQGNREQGIQGSGRRGAGALRAVALNGSKDDKLELARRTVNVFDPNLTIDQLLDHFHHLRRTTKGQPGEDWTRASIVEALNVAISERRAS